MHPPVSVDDVHTRMNGFDITQSFLFSHATGPLRSAFPEDHQLTVLYCIYMTASNM